MKVWKMMNASSLKSTKIETPKTPGGISKSLLTPCRRLGLSRNWKKAGPSPFVSPLSAANSSNVEVKVDKKPTRKRKERVEEENTAACELTPENKVENEVTIENDKCDISDTSAQKTELVNTPSRHVALPRRKKSKILLSEIKCKANDEKDLGEEFQMKGLDKAAPSEEYEARNEADAPKDLTLEKQITTPVQCKSKSKIKKKPSPMKSPMKSQKIDLKLESKISDSNLNNDLCINKENAETNIEKPKSVSPKDLTKECVVVIQKKMFKIGNKDSKKPIVSSKSPKGNMKTCKESEIIYDSSDEVPLSRLNTIENNNPKYISGNIITIENDDDSAETSKVPIKKLEHKNTSITGLKVKNKTKLKMTSTKPKPPITVNVESKPLSQNSNSFDDDDDEDFFENKKTILIRKNYDKVAKPSKAKSTGSITQKDIDALRARIEVKKLMLAKAVTSDTEELRSLIKKWQRGCQDALMELMDLMKAKCPDKQNMDYSEILQTLKIPAALVGYDSDNDCFNTPDDSSIVLAKYNNL